MEFTFIVSSFFGHTMLELFQFLKTSWGGNLVFKIQMVLLCRNRFFISFKVETKVELKSMSRCFEHKEKSKSIRYFQSYQNVPVNMPNYCRFSFVCNGTVLCSNKHWIWKLLEFLHWTAIWIFNYLDIFLFYHLSRWVLVWLVV